MRIQFEYMASSFEKSRCFILPRVSFCPCLPYVASTLIRRCFVSAWGKSCLGGLQNQLFSYKDWLAHYTFGEIVWVCRLVHFCLHTVPLSSAKASEVCTSKPEKNTTAIS